MSPDDPHYNVDLRSRPQYYSDGKFPTNYVGATATALESAITAVLRLSLVMRHTHSVEQVEEVLDAYVMLLGAFEAERS